MHGGNIGQYECIGFNGTRSATSILTSPCTKDSDVVEKTHRLRTRTRRPKNLGNLVVISNDISGPSPAARPCSLQEYYFQSLQYEEPGDQAMVEAGSTRTPGHATQCVPMPETGQRAWAEEGL